MFIEPPGFGFHPHGVFIGHSYREGLKKWPQITPDGVSAVEDNETSIL